MDGLHVETTQAAGHFVGSVSPKICHASGTAVQSMTSWEATWVGASSKTPFRKRSSRCSIDVASTGWAAKCLHSNLGQFHTQCLSMDPCPLEVLQGPTWAESERTHSPLWTSKYSTPSTILKRRRMTFLSRAPAALRPEVKPGSADACLEEVESVSFLGAVDGGLDQKLERFNHQAHRATK